MHITYTDAQNIVKEMKASIHHDINIMDENGIILASTNPSRQGQLHQGALQIIREQLPSLTIWEDDPDCGVQRGINLPVIINGQMGGVIGVTGDPEEVSVFGDVIKRMTEIMLERTLQREQLDLIERARSLFVESWLFSKELDWTEFEMRGRLLDIDINAPYTVALLQLEEQDGGTTTRTEDLKEMQNSLILRMVQNHLLDNRSHFCAVVHNRIIILLCRVDRRGAFQKTSSICRDIESYYGLKMSAGISDSSAASADIRRCYLEAKAAGAVAAKSADERVVFYDQVYLEFVVQSIPTSIRQDLYRMVFAACTPREKEDFARTIRLFFEHDGNIQKCAEKLFVHRNTVQYRIDCIKKRTGYCLTVPKDAMLLYLAI